jgi:hypothetical protein
VTEKEEHRGRPGTSVVLVAMGSLPLMWAAFLGGRGDLELGVGYRSAEGGISCPADAAPGAECTALAVVNTSDEPHGAVCMLGGSIENSWLTGGGVELQLERMRPWYSAPFTLVVEPAGPKGGHRFPVVECIATD